MAELPIGFENRTNQMSEKDMKLGKDAANRFANKGTGPILTNAYDGDGGSTGYKTSDEVRAFYMQQIEHQQGKNVATDTTLQQETNSSLPVGWEDRQRNRHLEVSQMGVFSSKNTELQKGSSMVVPASNNTPQVQNTVPRQQAQQSSPFSPEAALVNVATISLDAMAKSLEQRPVPLSSDERAAFATAMQRAMKAIANCR